MAHLCAAAFLNLQAEYTVTLDDEVLRTKLTVRGAGGAQGRVLGLGGGSRKQGGSRRAVRGVEG